jgi:hypothetical protein
MDRRDNCCSYLDALNIEITESLYRKRWEEFLASSLPCKSSTNFYKTSNYSIGIHGENREKHAYCWHISHKGPPCKGLHDMPACAERDQDACYNRRTL